MAQEFKPKTVSVYKDPRLGLSTCLTTPVFVCLIGHWMIDLFSRYQCLKHALNYKKKALFLNICYCPNNDIIVLCTVHREKNSHALELLQRLFGRNTLQ